MIKKILTAFGMVWTSISFAQAADITGTEGKALSLSDEALEEVEQICGSYIPDSLEFKQCVDIVSMDFTVVPHNTGGVGTCPGGAKECVPITVSTNATE